MTSTTPTPTNTETTVTNEKLAESINPYTAQLIRNIEEHRTTMAESDRAAEAGRALVRKEWQEIKATLKSPLSTLYNLAFALTFTHTLALYIVYTSFNPPKSDVFGTTFKRLAPVGMAAGMFYMLAGFCMALFRRWTGKEPGREWMVLMVMVQWVVFFVPYFVAGTYAIAHGRHVRG